MHDVFISFSFKDQEIVEEIVNQLLNRYHITYWICTRDVAAGSRYKRDIYDAIENARAVVLIQSNHALESKEIPKEVSLALDSEKTVIPFVIDHSKLNGDLAYDLVNVQRIDATKPTLDERIAELAAEIRKVIGDKPDESDTSSAGVYTLKSTRILPSVGFMGRSSELAQLHDALETYGKVFLQGIGGIGKSEIARQYALQYRTHYDSLIWATYDTTLKQMIISDRDIIITNFSRMNGETDDDYFIRKLDKLKELSSERTLIIVDNFDTSADKDLENFVHGEYSLIFTTRNDYSATGLPVIAVKELDAEEQFQLFLQNYGRSLKSNDEDCIREIIVLIDGHTLTIELVARLLQSRRTRPEKLLQSLREIGISQALIGQVSHGFQTDTAYAYIRHLFNVAALDDAEKAVLMNLSLMPLDGIDFDLFADLCGMGDCEVINSLIKRSWISYNAARDVIWLHSLINEVVTNECEPTLDKCQPMFDNLIGRLDKFQYRRMGFFDIKSYTNILLSIYHKFPNIDPQYITAYHVMIDMFIHAAFYSVALEIAEKTLYEGIDCYTEESEPVGITYYYLGDIHTYIGDHEKVVFYLKKAVHSLKCAKPDSLDYAYIIKYYLLHKLHNIDDYLFNGAADQSFNKEEILSLFHECERAFAASDEQTSYLVNNRGSFQGSLDHCYDLYYICVGMYDKAIQFAQKSYDFYSTSCMPEDKPWVMSPLSSLAFAYAHKGDEQLAVDYAYRALRISQGYYTETHDRTLRRWWHIANVYHILHLPQKEIAVLKQMKDIMEKCDNNSYTYQRVLDSLAILENNG